MTRALATVLPIALAMLIATPAIAQPRKRALLIGIDDYSASTLPRRASVLDRGWADLRGTVNDVEMLREMLVGLYGFQPQDVATLKNQQATRAAILQSLERHLVAPAARGDVVFFYFAGHGAQVPNAASDEPDRLDESIVPADSRRGAADIRDKELRPSFNRILDRGATLTLLLDHCHSGSAFRGLPNGARARGIDRAPRVNDPRNYGPRPEERGALVLASTQDLDEAWEKEGDDGRMHGAFTWAWIRALRDAAPGEAAEETFLRAQARMRHETPHQAPVMLGRAYTRRRPFLGGSARDANRTIIAVERVDADGTIVLQGGWAHGLTAGTLLRLSGDRQAPPLRITALLGAGRSVARAERAMPASIRSGALLEVVAWAAPPGRPLRVWMPGIAADAQTIAALASRLTATTKARLLSDPTVGDATHVLRRRGTQWELLARNGAARTFDTERATVAAVSQLPKSAALFVQWPAPRRWLAALAFGPGTEQQGIVPVADPRDADYILTGRYTKGGLEYAWIRPLARGTDLRGSALPSRTAWIAATRDSAASLRKSVLTLRRIHAWQTLESPPATRAPYQLALQREKTRELVRGGRVIGGETYTIALRASRPLPKHVTPRYYYVFVIDSAGRSTLAYPRAGSVENRFPLRNAAPPPEILLGRASAFRIQPPYGTDTYYLLSTEEPLANPSILEWNAVRAPSWTRRLTPLETLLFLTTTGTRASRALTPSRWSLERLSFEAMP